MTQLCGTKEATPAVPPRAALTFVDVRCPWHGSGYLDPLDLLKRTCLLEHAPFGNRVLHRLASQFCAEGALRLAPLVRTEDRLSGKMHERVGKSHDQS